MIKTPHILSTRKLNFSQVAELEKLGWTFTQHNFINKIIQVPSDCKRESIEQNVLLTSKSGVEAFLKISNELKLDLNAHSIYCISHATKEAAIAAGLHVHQASAASASLLADEILKNKTIRAVTHICSNRRRNELSEKLNAAGVEVQAIIAYRTEFTPVVVDHLYDAILFFSPSAMDSFLSVNPIKPVPCFCIGQTTTHHAKQKGYPHVYTSDAPTEETLLTTLTSYFLKTSAHA